MIANALGYSWSGVMLLVFVPVYIRVLGVESWAIIALSLSLQGFFSMFDMGLSTSLNREFARTSEITVDVIRARRDLLRTLECVYWPIALVLALCICSMGGEFATEWLNHSDLPVDTLARAVGLMGVAAALQWPTQLYVGGFRGLERQVQLNAINAVFSTLRNGGAAAIIVFVHPTLVAFLLWQVLVAGAQSGLMAVTLWRLLPSYHHPKFKKRELLRIRHFALGMGGVVILSFLLTQGDRLILSHVLSLAAFGSYLVASTASTSLSVFIQPFFSALFPRYSKLLSIGDVTELTSLYHKSNQFLAVIVASTTAVLTFYAEPLLELWTHNHQLAGDSAPALRLLVIGTGINGILNLPYALQLAYGWTGLALAQSVVSTLLFLPGVWWLSTRFGGVGAAAAWLVLNLISLLVSVPLMHRKLLPSEMYRWYARDIVPAVAAAFLVAGLSSVFITPKSNLTGVLLLGSVSAAVLFAAAICTESTRRLASSAFVFVTSKLHDLCSGRYV